LFLSPIVTPMKSVDLALNTLFGVFAQRDISKMRAEEIKKICDELLPMII